MSVAASLFWPRRRAHAYSTAVTGAIVIAAIVLAAAFAGLLAPDDPRAIAAPPISGPTARHPLGTNDLGQDLLSLWLFGARVSLVLGFLTATLSTAASGAVGMLSVIWRPARLPLVALTDFLLAVPHLPLLVLIIVLAGPGMWHLIAALALIGWPAYARVVRAQALAVAQRDYVEAARALGASGARILRTCFLPELLPLLWTKFLLTVRWAILMEAALALMGLGDPTRASWGTMLNSAFAYPLLFLGDAWLRWALPPALAIAAITLALSAIGRDFETWLNPAAQAGRQMPQQGRAKG